MSMYMYVYETRLLFTHTFVGFARNLAELNQTWHDVLQVKRTKTSDRSSETRCIQIQSINCPIDLLMLILHHITSSINDTIYIYIYK